MDTLAYFFQKFFEFLHLRDAYEIPNWVFWQFMIIAIVVCWIFYFFAKAEKWKMGQERFVPPSHVVQTIVSVPEASRGANVIDFVTAGRRVRDCNHPHNRAPFNRAVVEEVRALRGNNRDSFDFSLFNEKGILNDDGPDAA